MIEVTVCAYVCVCVGGAGTLAVKSKAFIFSSTSIGGATDSAEKHNVGLKLE